MPASIIDGKAVAEEIRTSIAAEAEEMTRSGRPPKLVAVQVGEDPASKLYTDMQARQCESAGLVYELMNLPEDISQDGLAAAIGKLNSDVSVSGLILQMPLPDHLDASEAQLAIAPEKDVEGIHPVNLGRLFSGTAFVYPCTPLAAVELLTRTCDDLNGKEAVIVGRSNIVGKPIATMLLNKAIGSPTVTVCHSRTRDLAFHTRRADIIIAATGYPQMVWSSYRKKKKADQSTPAPDIKPLITGQMLGEGQIIIDVATNRVPKELDENGMPVKNEKGKNAMRTIGDVDSDAAMEKAAAVTPVPGGVGPVTVSMLLQNTLECAKALKSR